MLRQLLGQQMAAGDLHLLLVGVTAEADNLHPVQQGLGNGVRGVGGGNEHHPAQVHGNLHIVVPERMVLLAVQHFQQGRGRVSPVIVPQLIDLVQQQQRVHGPAPDDGVNDPAGHGADVGPPVAPDVRLVPDTAQGKPGQLPVQRLGNADGNGGFSHPRRAHQTQNLPLAFGVHLPDGDGLQNPFLHLRQAEMILFQHLPGGLHADALPRLRVPGHLQAYIQIVSDHRRLGAAIGLAGELPRFLQQVLLRLLLQLQLQNLAAIILNFILVVLPQLVLEDPNLRAENLVPLRANQLVPNLALHLMLKTQDAALPGQKAVQLPHPDEGGQLL